MKKQEKGSLQNLIQLLKLDKSEIGSIYFYAILSGIIQLSLPIGIQAIIGFVLGAKMVTSVYVLIFLILLAVLAVGYLQINQMKIVEKIQQKIFVRYALQFSEKIPRLNIKDIDNYYLPEKINRFFDTLNIQKGISKLLLDIPIATIQILFGLVLLSLYHPLFIVFALLLVILLWIMFKVTSSKGLKTSVEESNHKYNVVAWLQEMGRVIASFKYSQGTHLNLLKTDAILLKYISARTSHFKVLLFQYNFLVFFKVSITALMLLLGTYLLFNQLLNVGEFVAAEIVIITIINAIEKIIISLENVYDVITGLIKTDSVLEIEEDKDGTIQLNSNTINIEISNVSFSYNIDTNSVLENVSLSIPSNSITIISGEENSGKSTFLKLLAGTYNNYNGSITINNIPFQNYLLQSIRSKTGILLYEQDIFEGSVYDNISLGRTNISIENIMEVAKQLKIEDFISSFPQSFDTILHPLGQKLPSSLTKKIILLRALVNNPALLILENPFMGFDEDTNTNIKNYLLDIAKSRTIIISSNDAEFTKKCKVAVLIHNKKVTIK
jgi:ATP-binding cassette, subfamily B, bacterial